MRYKLFFLLVIVSFFAACGDELDKISPKHAISLDELSEADISKLINGVYHSMESFVFNGYFDGDVMGENYKAGPAHSLVDPVHMTPGDNMVLNRWRRAFNSLNQVNALINVYENSPNKSISEIKVAGGTAYYFRALIYYNLVIRWGDVPILRNRSTRIIPLSPAEKVWEMIEEDLLKAEELLPNFYNMFYVSKSAVHALLARAYLAQNKYELAVLYSEKLLEAGFRLAANSNEYAQIFNYNTNSPEIIFALANRRTSGTLLFYQRVNDVISSWDYSPADNAYKHLYENDPIRTGDIRRDAVFGNDERRLIKFANGREGQFIINENPTQTPIIVHRIAEAYLIKSEALGFSGGISTLEDFLANRYSNINFSALNSNNFQDFILDERNREFYGEGFRWYDLKRTNRIDLFESLNGRNHLMYWPIPQNEIDLVGESNYPQNPGY